MGLYSRKFSPWNWCRIDQWNERTTYLFYDHIEQILGCTFMGYFAYHQLGTSLSLHVAHQLKYAWASQLLNEWKKTMQDGSFFRTNIQHFFTTHLKVCNMICTSLHTYLTTISVRRNGESVTGRVFYANLCLPKLAKNCQKS